MIFEAIQTREPQRRICIVRLDFQNCLELLDGLLDIFLLHFAGAHVAQRAHVNARQQPVRGQIVRIDLQNFLRLVTASRMRCDFA